MEKSKEFVEDRRRALLSMNRQQILDYARKYNLRPEGRALDLLEESEFWVQVHKMRTAASDLPRREREKSRRWLLARGIQPLG